MTIFKTFLKIANKYKLTIIIYTVILLAFSVANMKSSDNSMSFIATKPDILIINNDQKEGITKSLIEYIQKNSNIANIKEEEDAINDALFYRDINYVIYIPNNYRQDFLDNKNPEIKIKSTGDYAASLSEMMLKKYIQTANTYKKAGYTEEEIINNIEDILLQQTEVEVTSKLDIDKLENATFYYNFQNYALLAGCVFIICIILSSFKQEAIRKRTIVSSMKYRKYNRKMLLSSALFAIILWSFYIIISFILLGNIMFTKHGLVYIINSFIFTICALTIGLLIGNIVKTKEAVNGIVNVVALGSSFLCGVFVPIKWLPDSVLKVAHILPSYWYVKTNEALKTMEQFNTETLKPIIINMGVVVIFTVIFIIINNIISRKQRKIN
ncbi:MAG: ABC transporter permease [Clostridia bacterium]|jgi:ABC-2 type transport system permease protein|nr:ABC transporter permease [Clostridia bacterium]